MLQTPSTVIEPFLLNLAIQQIKEERGKMAFVESAHFFFSRCCAQNRI
jgi:hypothetical protein